MKKEILVIGSVNMDLIIELERVPESGESLAAKQYTIKPGGKGANQAIALAKLGADVSFVGKIGQDTYGRNVQASLSRNRVRTDKLLIDDLTNTGTAFILLEANGNNRIVVANGANDRLTSEDIDKYLYRERQYSLILVQLEIPLKTIEYIIERAKGLSIPIIVDAGPVKQCDLSIFNGVDIISPNQTEIYGFTSIQANTVEEAKVASKKLKEETNCAKVFLKMGEMGSLLYDGSKYQYYRAFEIDVKDSTAAGDAYTAALAYGYIQNWSDKDTITFANAAGALTVSKLGAHSAVPDRGEVKRFLASMQGKGV